jgi:pro-kumamolisin-like protein
MRGNDHVEIDAISWTGGILMKRTYFSQLSLVRILLSIMFTVLVVSAPFVRPKRALSAENEPMVPLSRIGPPQSLPATTTPARADMVLNLRIYLDIRNKEAARKLTEDQQNASSPSYRKWLKTGQFDEMFGPLQTSYDAIAAWLTSQGFTVTAVRRDRRDIEFTGTVAQADGAFQVQIMNMSDGQHYRATSVPMIPARFQGVILGVIGLDNLLTTGPQTSIGTPAITAFAPTDFYTFYDENALLAAGINGNIPDQPSECLGIVGVSDYLSAAITLFYNQFLLSPPSITPRYANTNSPGPTHDMFETEAELDLEWGHAAAPGAPLTFYLGNLKVSSTALLDAFQLAETDNTCGTISVSFYVCDTSGGYYALAFELSAMKAAAQGQSVFVSSDDFGSASPCGGSNQDINPIAASAYVTSVGGTQFSPTYAGLNNVLLYGQTKGTDVGFVLEGVWDVLTGVTAGASGGGPAVGWFDKPNYQSGRTPADSWRDVPDVALVAGHTLNPSAFIGDDPLIQGSPCQGPNPCIDADGGTSLATVLWAGISKLVQQQLFGRLGNINPELYSLAELGPTAGIRDVTGTATPSDNGFNGAVGWRAEDGYDLATGWGTPDITTFVNLFASDEVVLIGGDALGGSIQTGEAYDPASQTFTSLGSVMSAGRVNYGIAKLPDGRFLLAGGNNGSSILKTADIFDPVTNTFMQASHNMANPYFDFAQAVTLESQPSPTSGYAHGGVFIIGMDTTGNGKLWTEIYDPVSQTFSTPVKIIGTNEPETGYTTTLLGNSRFSGQVLIQGFTSTAELYDPIAKTFTATINQPPQPTLPGNQHSPLYFPAAVLLSNGKVLVAGGLAGTIYPSSFAYLYDPSTNTFTVTGSLNQARCEPTAVALPNGKAMVFGQAGRNNVFQSCVNDPTVEIYDPATGTFTQTQTTTTRVFPFVSIVPNPGNNLTAQILIAGGESVNAILNTAELYDPTFGTFTALNSTMTTASFGGYASPAR